MATSMITLPASLISNPSADQVRGFRAWNEHRPDHQISQAKLLADGVAVAVEDVDVGGHDVIEIRNRSILTSRMVISA